MRDCARKRNEERRQERRGRRPNLLDGLAQGAVRSVDPDDARDNSCVTEEKNLDTLLQRAMNCCIFQHACGAVNPGLTEKNKRSNGVRASPDEMARGPEPLSAGST